MSPPRVLLVYANPASTPSPVGPYGMERVAPAFAAAGCAVRLSAPFLEADPRADLQAALAWPPDLVGFSVRNIDDTLVVRAPTGEGEVDTAFYLDAVRPLVQDALAALGPERVVLGGTAVGAGPEAVLAYLGAELAVAGPAEDLCLAAGRAMAEGLPPSGWWPDDPRVVRASRPAPRGRGFAAAWMTLPGAPPRMRSYLGLTVARAGRAAVLLSAGCDRRCVFCVEPRFTGHRVMLRDPEAVLDEIRQLAAAGVRRFWLAASELNVPGEQHTIAVLRGLAGAGLDLAGFLQPAPVTDALLDAMEAAGMDPEGVNYELGHLDDGILRAGGGPTNRAAINRLVETYLRRGHRRLGGSILLGAHPQETWQTIDAALAAARQIDAAFPHGLGLAYAAGARVYPETPLARWIAQHPEDAAGSLYGAVEDASFARVVVFSRPASPRRLLGYIQAALAGSRGQMGPMNVEVTVGPEEALVNRAILRAQEGAWTEAAALLQGALQQAPDHAEALRQLALVQANHLGQPEAAGETLRRLLALLPPDSARAREVQAALAHLSAR